MSPKLWQPVKMAIWYHIYKQIIVEKFCKCLEIKLYWMPPPYDSSLWAIALLVEFTVNCTSMVMQGYQKDGWKLLCYLNFSHISLNKTLRGWWIPVLPTLIDSFTKREILKLWQISPALLGHQIKYWVGNTERRQ